MTGKWWILLDIIFEQTVIMLFKSRRPCFSIRHSKNVFFHIWSFDWNYWLETNSSLPGCMLLSSFTIYKALCAVLSKVSYFTERLICGGSGKMAALCDQLLRAKVTDSPAKPRHAVSLYTSSCLHFYPVDVVNGKTLTRVTRKLFTTHVTARSFMNFRSRFNRLFTFARNFEVMFGVGWFPWRHFTMLPCYVRWYNCVKYDLAGGLFVNM